MAESPTTAVPLKPAAPPPSGAKPPPAPAADAKEDPKKDAPKNQFSIADASKFSIDQMLAQGSVSATLKLQDKITATFRTLSVDEIQKVEAVMPLNEMREKTLKYMQNEMTILQLYYSMTALNGKDLPAAVEGEDDKRMNLLRQLPGVLFDILVRGYSEFDRRAQELVSGEALRTF